MNLITSDVVVEFVKVLWPMYAGGDKVAIERLPRSPSCPAIAMVMYNKGDALWYVLIDGELSPKETFIALAHELAHVVNGDSDKDEGAVSLALHRDMFIGGKTFIADLMRSKLASRQGEPQHRVQEDGADDFAVRFVQAFLPVLESMDDLMLDAIHKIKTKM